MCWVVAIALIVLFPITAANIFSSAILPDRYAFFAILIALIISGGVCIGLVATKEPENHKIRISILGVFSALLIFAHIFLGNILNMTSSFLSNIQERDLDHEEYNLVVLNEVDDNFDATDKTICYLNQDPFRDNVSAHIAGKMKAVPMSISDPTTLEVSMLDKTCDASLINDAYLSLYEENNEDFFASIKTIRKERVAISQGKVSTSQTPVTEPFTVFISGIDTYGQIGTVSRSDVNIIAIINPVTHEVLTVNTPRDYYVQLHGTTGTRDKLTHAGIYGVIQSVATLQDLYGINIDYYVRVNFTTLVNVVDAIGGIEVNVEQAFTSRAKKFRFEKGVQHMDGAHALEFSRERYSFAAGDRTRGHNQQLVIVAIMKKALQPSIITNYSQFLEALGGSMQTNMGTEQMKTLIRNQLNAMHGWNYSAIAVDGSGAMLPTHSMGAQKLWVMEPNWDTVNTARDRMRQILGK